MRSIFNTLTTLTAVTVIQAYPHHANCNSTSLAISPAATSQADAQLLRDLVSSPTAIQRSRRLLVEEGVLRTGDDLRQIVVFDFNDPQPAVGAMGGASKAATVETYPFSIGLDISATVVFLEPCGINTPHVHPRAAEFLTLIEGSNLRFGSILEDGLVKPGENQEITGTLNRLQATAFAQGSMHWQFNDACEKAVYVAVLGSGDAGTNRMTNFLSLDADVVSATLGLPSNINSTSIKQFGQAIPANLVQDVNKCLARCRPAAA